MSISHFLLLHFKTKIVLLFLIVKDRSYILYVLYGAFAAMFVLILSGYFVEKFQADSRYQEHFVLYSGILASGCYFLFANSVLRLKESYPPKIKGLMPCPVI